jgi:hypothetical protein
MYKYKPKRKGKYTKVLNCCALKPIVNPVKSQHLASSKEQ